MPACKNCRHEVAEISVGWAHVIDAGWLNVPACRDPEPAEECRTPRCPRLAGPEEPGYCLRCSDKREELRHEITEGLFA